MESCKLPCECLKLNVRHLEVQSVLSIAEPLLLLLKTFKEKQRDAVIIGT